VNSKNAEDALQLLVSIRLNGYAASQVTVGDVSIIGLIDLQGQPQRVPLPAGKRAQVPARPTAADELLAEYGAEAYEELRAIANGTTGKHDGGIAVVEEDD
jgi:hypothetical protein